MAALCYCDSVRRLVPPSLTTPCFCTQSGASTTLFMKTSILLTSLTFVVVSGFAQNQAVTTVQYDNSRTGANTAEIILNTANVNALSFGKLSSWPVDGFVFAQPLYVPGLNINGAVRNVLFVATMNNSIYAFDTAQPGSAPLWHMKYGPTVTNIGQYCP